jgi:hypothetical protein
VLHGQQILFDAHSDGLSMTQFPSGNISIKHIDQYVKYYCVVGILFAAVNIELAW